MEREDRVHGGYTYDPPERFVAGTVGQPGERTFYLQASGKGRVTSVVLEKIQVSRLAERLDELLDDELRNSGGKSSVPAVAPASLTDDGPLDLPLLEEFRVGVIALAWDGEGERVVIEAQEESETPVEYLSEDVPEDGPGVLRVRITRCDRARVHSARAADRGPGPAAVPAVRPAARRLGAHLPAAERAPSQQCVSRRSAASGSRRGGLVTPAGGSGPPPAPVSTACPGDDAAALGLLANGSLDGAGQARRRVERDALLHGERCGQPGGLRLQARGR